MYKLSSFTKESITVVLYMVSTYKLSSSTQEGIDDGNAPLAKHTVTKKRILK